MSRGPPARSGRIWRWRSVPLSPPPDSSCHDNRATHPAFVVNLHFNGVVIGIKKLRLEGTEPCPSPWEPKTNPPAQPCPDALLSWGLFPPLCPAEKGLIQGLTVRPTPQSLGSIHSASGTSSPSDPATAREIPPGRGRGNGFLRTTQVFP